MKDTFIITRPWITEKSTILNEGGKYVFMVKPSATKNEVKKAIQTQYKVGVVNVNIVNIPPKSKRFRGAKTKRGGLKKAIVTLKSGDKIDFAI